MRTVSPYAALAVLTATGGVLAGCGGPDTGPGGPAAAAAPPAITNRIPLSAEVVANLGITFEKAKRGRLETRLRVPGRVEVAPEARFVVRAPAAGRVTLRAARWQRVARGDVVGELLSADLRAAQALLADTVSDADRAQIDLERARAEAEPLAAIADATEQALGSAREREKAAESALGVSKELERAAAARLAEAQRHAADGSLSEGALYAIKREHAEAQTAEFDASRRHDESHAAIPDLQLKLASARSRAATSDRELAILERRRATAESSARQQLRGLSVMTGIPVAELEAKAEGVAAWARLEAIPLRAPSSGIVAELLASDAEWVESAGAVLRVIDATKMVFRGEIPEADAHRVPPQAEASIDIGCAGCGPVATRLEAARHVADPKTRTILLEALIPGDASSYPDGASATLSVLLERSKSEETLLPAATIVQDELETIVFRRDPAKPDQVIRTPVSIGRRSEGWVEVLSEVAEGDEVVRSGIHQLRLTGIGKAPATGHFHADGSWHEGKD